jgi:FtsZ-binding cell division protein ZapB
MINTNKSNKGRTKMMQYDLSESMEEHYKLQMEIERLKSINIRLCDSLNKLHESDNEKFRKLRELKDENETLVNGIKELLQLVGE